MLDVKDWNAALTLLNQAVLMAPSPSTTLSSALYSRAEALLGLGESSLALRDATLAGIKGCWPEERLYKLYQLQAQCQAALGEGSEASKCLHRALSALDRSGLAEGERTREKSEIQHQLGIVTKRRDNKKKRENRREDTVKLVSANIKYPSLSSCLAVEHDKERGRHVVVRSREVQVGEVLGVEEPLVHCLNLDQLDQRCSLCLASVLAPLPCASCRQVSLPTLTPFGLVLFQSIRVLASSLSATRPTPGHL